jgi:hypothetical protein
LASEQALDSSLLVGQEVLCLVYHRFRVLLHALLKFTILARGCQALQNIQRG